MTDAEIVRPKFEDRLVEAIAMARTTARVAATEMENTVEPAMPPTTRELSEKLRAEMETETIVSTAFRARLRQLLDAIDAAIIAETTKVPVPLDGLLFAPGKEGTPLTERRLSSAGRRLQAARDALEKLDSCIVMALDQLDAARTARRLLER